MTNETQGQLSRSWEDFRHLPFPSGFHSREPDGECMVTMDATLAGCISSAMDGQLRAVPQFPADARRQLRHLAASSEHPHTSSMRTSLRLATHRI